MRTMRLLAAMLLLDLMMVPVAFGQTSSTTLADTTAPVVSHVTIVPSESSFSFAWDVNEATTVNKIWYGVNFATSAVTGVADATGRHFTALVQSLQPGTSYYYIIEAIDAANNKMSYSGTTQTSAPADTTPPTAPYGLKAGWTGTNDSVVLSWQDKSANETKFEIYRRTVGANVARGPWTSLGLVGANVTSYPVTGIPTGSYEWKVEACNDAGCTPNNEIVATIFLPFCALNSPLTFNSVCYCGDANWSYGYCCLDAAQKPYHSPNSTSSCPSSASSGSASDSPPVVSAFVKSANNLHPNTMYAGLRAYFSVTITDDKGIASASVNAPDMKYSSANVNLSQCANNVTSCSEKVYIIVPNRSGVYTLTFTAKDSSGQTATQTVNFTAQGCAADSECGGTYFNSGTATYCSANFTQRLQGQTKAVCSSGVCNETGVEGVLEDCAAGGKVCGFSPTNGGQYQCVIRPAVNCVIGQTITAACLCGAGSYESYGRCCLDNGRPYHTVGECLTYASPTPTATPVSGVTSTPSTVPLPSWVTSSPTSSGVWPFSTPSIVPAPTLSVTPSLVPTVSPPLVVSPIPLFCPLGQALSAANQCVVPSAPQALQQCLAAGGTWCPSGSGNGNGYCLPAGAACERTAPISASPAAIAPLPQHVAEAVVKKIEEQRSALEAQEKFLAERRALLQDIRAIERLVKRDAAEVDEKELKALKNKLLAVKPGAEIDPTVLSIYRDKINELKGTDEAIEIPESADPAAEARALRQMKQGLRQFERFIAAIESKMKQVEQSKVSVDGSIKEAVAMARGMAKRVQDAKTYDDVRDIVPQMPDIGQSLNDAIPRLEELLRLPRVLKLVDGRVAEGERAIKQAQASAKRLKLEVADRISAMKTLLAEAKDAVATLKASGTTDIADAIEAEVFDRVDEIIEMSDYIRTVANIRQAAARANADVRKYQNAIVRQERAGGNMADAYALLDELKEQVAELRTVAAEKLTPETGERLIDYLRVIGDLREQMEELLGITPPDVLEVQIKKLFASPGEKIKPFQLDQLEQAVL